MFGEYQGAQFNNPYTRISPESENIAKVRIKYNTPVKNLNVTGTGLWRRRVNPDQDYRSNATILSGGLTYEGIYKGLGARLYGSYAKTTKEDPQIYADGLISLYYKNKWLTPIVTLERTYLTDKVNRADGFRANLLTFSLKKEF